jgi:type IV secretory pathway VirB3-like protein
MARPSSAPLFAAATRPRHLFLIDRRFFPPVFICAFIGVFIHLAWPARVCFLTIAAVVYVGARLQWELAPYFWEEVQRELMLPKRGVADAYFDSKPKWWRVGL